jgi:hypothetical protein
MVLSAVVPLSASFGVQSNERYIIDFLEMPTSNGSYITSSFSSPFMIS